MSVARALQDGCRPVRCAVAVLALAVCLAQSGCAKPLAAFPVPPSEDIRSTFGRIGVTYVEGPATQEITTPPEGACESMGRGAVAGMIVDGWATLILAAPGAAGNVFGVVWIVGALGVGITCLPVAALIGSIYGGIAAPPAEQVEAGLAAIRGVLSEQKISREIALRIAQSRGSRTDADLKFLEPGADRAGLDTILEVGKPVLLLNGRYGVNPPLKLFVTVTARIIRVSDRKLLYECKLTGSRPVEHEFLDWTLDDGRDLRAGLEKAAVDLPDRFVEELFLLRLLLPVIQVWR